MFLIALAAAAALVGGPVKQPTSVADPVLTPGVVRHDLTDAQIRSTKWGKDHRAVTAAMKTNVYRRYGFTGPHDPRCTPDPVYPKQTCEVDHRIPRCLAGADDMMNLSPEPYGGAWNAHDKDRVEAKACRMFNAGQISLTAAQAIFMGDWTVTYTKWFGGTILPEAGG